MRRLCRDSRGSVALIVAGGMAALLGCTALAVDMGSVYLNARALQGVADAAALSAASAPENAEAAAAKVVAANGWTASTLHVEPGRYLRDPAVPVAQRFVPDAAAPDAARVTVSAETPLWFAGALTGRHSLTIARSATAMRVNQAAFSIGTRLAGVQGGVANALIGKLVGGTIDLSVADYDALLGSDIELFATLEALRTKIGLAGVSYAQLLETEVSAPVLLGALASALNAAGRADAAGALLKIAAAAAPSGIRLGDLIDLGPLARQSAPGGVSVTISAWDFAQAAIQLSGGARQVKVDIAPDIAGLVGAELWLAIGNRPEQSPWLTLTRDGDAVVRTAQTRLYLNTRIGIGGLPLGAGNLLNLPLYVELGPAEARLAALSCPSSATAKARLAVTTGLGHIAIRAVDPAALDDFSRPMAESPADLVKALVLTVKADVGLNLGGATPQYVEFTRADVTAGTIRTVSTDDLVGGLTASLLATPNAITIAPLNLGVGTLLGTVLTPLASPLDGLVNGITGLLGLRLGQADVRVNGLRCGQPVLVA